MRKIVIWAACAVSALAMAGVAEAQGGGGRMLDMLLAQDANHDGSITHAEAEAARAAVFAHIDANHDGNLSADERAAMPMMGGRGGGPGADANNDGVVSRAEFMAQPYRAFDNFDANHDNTLDASEIAALRARFAQ